MSTFNPLAENFFFAALTHEDETTNKIMQMAVDNSIVYRELFDWETYTRFERQDSWTCGSLTVLNFTFGESIVKLVLKTGEQGIQVVCPKLTNEGEGSRKPLYLATLLRGVLLSFPDVEIITEVAS